MGSTWALEEHPIVPSLPKADQIQDATGRWYCCNDAYVSDSTAQEVLSEKVYILFYLRSNQKPKSSTSAFACNGLKVPESNGNNARLSQKLSVNIRQPVVKQNGILHSENGIVMSNSANANGRDASSSHKSSIPLKSPVLKLNGSLHPDKDTTTVLKNNKISSRPMMNFALKNMEKRDACKNENGNLKVHSNNATEKNSSELSRVVKSPNILPLSKSTVKSTSAKDKEEFLGSAPIESVNHSSDDSDPVEKNTNDASTSSNRNGHSTLIHVGGIDNNDTLKMPPAANGPEVTHGHDCYSGFFQITFMWLMAVGVVAKGMVLTTMGTISTRKEASELDSIYKLRRSQGTQSRVSH
ncbi:hypothetical protein Taro_020375 [Colocasia esculenta]|uniref:USP domain-containing protein n=1 Tax=Colocasia esculenta TaxID=4460 RepID=A0A843UZF3_COLES|nr:hypothetical protein [Colocasia esculenta]